MRIIKLDAIGSTNTYAKNLLASKVTTEPLLIWTTNQTDGRGQRGNNWISKKGESLTFSILMRPENITVAEHFYISMITSLAIVEVLEKYQIPNLNIKWPNDILADGKKIGGILIENGLKGNQIDSSIIGFGMNVNQNSLENLPKASSLKRLTGTSFNIETLLEQLAKRILTEVQNFKKEHSEILRNDYLSRLFRKDEHSLFNIGSQHKVPGIIRGIDNNGCVLIELEDSLVKEFDVKEIEMLY